MPDKERQYLSESRSKKSKDHSFSFMALTLYIMGALVIFGGIFQGLKLLREARILANQGRYIRYIAITYLGGGIICGMLFIGFGKNITLLQDIKDKLDEL